jgi:serine phosphatase RsbU (regulator of sigma subunit)
LRISKRNIGYVLVVLAFASWLVMIAASLWLQFNYQHAMPQDIPVFTPSLALMAFTLFAFLFFRSSIGTSDNINILDLLWKVFVTGLIAVIISLASYFTFRLMEGTGLAVNPYFIAFIYNLNVGLVLLFLISTFVVWKRLILFQKSKKLVVLYNLFEYSLFASLVLSLLDIQLFNVLYSIVFGYLLLLGVILSVNLKWVPYLNFKQKWKSILLNLLVTLYLSYLFFYMSFLTNKEVLVFNLSGNITVQALFAFVLIYALFSVLVTLFNLPTSSVFEQKLEEVLNFQRLSQSRNTDHSEDQIYEILLDSSVSAVIATAAWLEIYESNSTQGKLLFHKMGMRKKEEIEAGIDESKARKLMSSDPVKNLKTNRYLANLKDPDYKSILVFPLFVQNRHLGRLVLLKDLTDGFNREMIEVISTFVNQASISIENYRLLGEALENERYKEELEIAKRVQGSLLPQYLEKNHDFDITAYTKAAAEVGGDYYDTYRINPHKVALIIGDVSGKGTSAAFHMSQMKGIFQSLVQLDLSPRDFILKANHALGNCLDRTSFITTSFFIIDAAQKQMSFTRAGHCPTLIYKKTEDTVYFLEDSGLGLGILRDDQFEKYIHVNTMQYHPGDILFLYTDGITEAKNPDNEEFGFLRLKEYLKGHSESSPTEIEHGILQALNEFCGTKLPDDDFTMMIVKFK